MSSLTAIHYQGRPAALAGRTRVWPQPWLCDLPTGHPTRHFVFFMCHYARLITEEQLPGPYTHDQARRFARLALLSDQPITAVQPCPADESAQHIAARLGLPPDELEPARADLAALRAPQATRLGAYSAFRPRVLLTRSG